ncbi:N-terminal machado-Joseph disease protein like domain [Cryptosporidium ryanae]|uniref:N-terminal machado-Joseph disease protein like domain n=1 Tax=Cryptosporidium ryanae TaxID=515981 RepID=UPI00351A05FF|nr:N-terminal machado-Joseph disease protein like domain [Cryptosporidium ryanae]
MENSKDDFIVYWEKQGNDRMCALHCINSILQGPYVDEFQLSKIAREIDELESRLLKEDTKNSVMGKGASQNVSDDGFFSIMVLQECLQRMGYSCIPAANPNVQDLIFYPTSSCGYIINSSEHWTSIRCVGGKWFNLDSLKPGPIILDYQVVSKELQQFIFSGKSVFVVQRNPNESGNNTLPDPDPFLRPINSGDKQRYYLTLSEIDELFRIKRDEDEKEAKFACMSSGDNDFSRNFINQKKEHIWPTTKGNTLKPEATNNYGGIGNSQENDPELERAIRESSIEFASKISLPEEPDIGNKEAVQIRVRTKIGKSFTRRFEKSQACSLLFLWIEHEMALYGNPIIQGTIYSLISQFPNYRLTKNSNGIVEVSDSSGNSKLLNSPSLNDIGIVENSLLLLDI